MSSGAARLLPSAVLSVCQFFVIDISSRLEAIDGTPQILCPRRLHAPTPAVLRRGDRHVRGAAGSAAAPTPTTRCRRYARLRSRWAEQRPSRSCGSVGNVLRSALVANFIRPDRRNYAGRSDFDQRRHRGSISRFAITTSKAPVCLCCLGGETHSFIPRCAA